jgi:hypothetical protein
VARNTTPAQPIEVVVAARDGAVRRLSLVPGEPPEFTEVTRRADPVKALDEAWRRTSNTIIAFVAANAVPDDRWLADIAACFAQAPDLQGVGGNIQPLWPHNIFSRACYDLGHATHRRLNGRWHLALTNAAFRRAALEAAGGFADRPGAADEAITVRMHRAGATLRTVARAVAYLGAPSTLREFLAMAGDTTPPRAPVPDARTGIVRFLRRCYRQARNGPSQPAMWTAVLEAALGCASAMTTRPPAQESLDSLLRRVTPRTARVAIMTYGDGRLLRVAGRECWHFPCDDTRTHVPHRPEDSAEALAHLARVRRLGATHLAVPADSMWWLDFYQEFGARLADECPVAWRGPSCIVFTLA